VEQDVQMFINGEKERVLEDLLGDINPVFI
jgi:hypothetical protein